MKNNSMKFKWFERGAYATKKARSYLENEFNPTSVKNIAIIRHAALGDQVIVRPFIIEARKFFPNAHITLIGVSNYQYGMPADLVDSVHIMHGKDRKNEISLKEKIANIKELGPQDIIFDLASTNRSHWMMALSQSKLKVGFPYKNILRGLLYNVTVARSDFQPEVECMLDMLKLLGHNPKHPLDFGYPDHRMLRDSVKPFIFYFNGASQQSKILTKEAMKAVIQQSIIEHPNMSHIYLEGKNDFEKGDYLHDLTSLPNFSIQPCLELNELILLIAKASLLVAPDTGIRNIAISTHTPTVGIFYSTVPFRYTPLYELHSIVMNSDSRIPTSAQICNAISESLDTLKDHAKLERTI
jgi:ADP-heptose:LPS heptosyltransferase